MSEYQRCLDRYLIEFAYQFSLKMCDTKYACNLTEICIEAENDVVNSTKDWYVNERQNTRILYEQHAKSFLSDVMMKSQL